MGGLFLGELLQAAHASTKNPRSERECVETSAVVVRQFDAIGNQCGPYRELFAFAPKTAHKSKEANWFL